MKKLMILALAIGMAGAVSAQGVAVSASSATSETKTERTEKKESMTPEQRADKMTKRQSEMLNLTPEQYKKAYAINLERAKEMANIKAERMETKEQARDAQTKSDKSFQEILTPEQQKIWNEKKENAQEKRNEMRQERSESGNSGSKTSEAGKSCCAGKEEGKSCSSEKKTEEKK